MKRPRGVSIVQLQYLDNQFTVTGFYHRSVLLQTRGAPVAV